MPIKEIKVREEFRRLIHMDFAARTGVGQARDSDTGELIGQPECYLRIRFAYPGQTINVHVTFAEKKYAKLAKRILMESLILATSDDDYNQRIRDFLNELQHDNPRIKEFVKGDEQKLITGPSKGDKDGN